jgi:hypothetical protein
LGVHEVKDKTTVVILKSAGRQDAQLRRESYGHQDGLGKINFGSLYRVETKKPGLGIPAGPQ